MDLTNLSGRLQTAFGRPELVVPRADVKNAAVALVLRDRSGAPGDVEALFIRRAQSERDHWSGHMALPGGRLDATDPSLVATAMRETLEETGLDLWVHGKLVGRIEESGPVGGGVPSVAIFPFVFWADPRAQASVSSPEVSEVHWYSIHDLLHPVNRGLYHFQWRGQERRYPCIRMGDRVVWGLTYRILETFFAV